MNDLMRRLAARGLRTTLALAASVLSTFGGPSARAGDWPSWQGPDRNAVSKETGLLREWPKDGPPLAWKATGIGKGMGGIAVSKGRIYTTGDDAKQTAWLYALNESDGKPVWSAKIGPGGNPGNMFKPFGPRATRTVEGDRIYILSQTGDFVCLDLATGKQLWMEREAPKGSLTLADGRLYLRTERGAAVLIEPNREKFVERGRFEQPDRTRDPAWAHPVIANGRMSARSGRAALL
jgi:outer membrane protein assembly factor BamB